MVNLNTFPPDRLSLRWEGKHDHITTIINDKIQIWMNIWIIEKVREDRMVTWLCLLLSNVKTKIFWQRLYGRKSPRKCVAVSQGKWRNSRKTEFCCLCKQETTVTRIPVSCLFTLNIQLKQQHCSFYFFLPWLLFTSKIVDSTFNTVDE